LNPGAVLLDAFGTLVTLDAPAPRLRALLAERLGVAVTEDQAAAALRAEITFYRAHMHEGIDLARVAQLQARCAEVLRGALPAQAELERARPAAMTAILLDTLSFRPYDEVPATLARLRQAGLRLIVASNWDASLATVLERVGLLAAVDGVVTSASTGYAKPDPRLIEAAVRLSGAARERAVHVGDSLGEDVAAARRAGVRPVLLRREASGLGSAGPGDGADAELLVIAGLGELPALLGL
jgi:putative hydrolase of the HAD superfamily